MAFLEAGVAAPEVTLEDADGKTLSLADQAKGCWLLAVFYKVGCGTCKFSAPYFEKIHQAYGGNAGFKVLGVSQDTPEDTRAFMDEHGATFENVYDTTHWASADFGLTNVPTWFLMDEGGGILDSNTGFCRSDLNELSVTIAGHLGEEAVVISPGDDGAPELKPG